MSDKRATEAIQQWNKTVPWTWDGLELAVLFAILEELKQLNATMQCSRTQAIPMWLERIAKNTAKPKRKRRKV